MAEAPRLRILPFYGKLLLRGGQAVHERVDAALGFPLPGEPLRATVGVGAEALGLGPDEWLLLVPPALLDEAVTTLTTALNGLHHALVDVSERFIGLGVEGGIAADVLAAGCPLDLHPRSFPPGTATRTLLGKVEVILHRPEGHAGFRLYIGRSFLAYAWRYLLAAGREHGMVEVTAGA
jgi:sarcosine oxidase subunit gamma